MIELSALQMRFDAVTAVDDVTLTIGEGEFVTLLGPSGCGKTTLLRMISGFLTPTAGTIRLNGEDVTAQPPERRDTALCFQSYALFPHLTVAENIDFGPRQAGVARADRTQRLEQLLRQVDLEPQRSRLPNALSGGQQQRVALARALAIQPSVVLFDEPLSNLDAKLRDQVRREIRTLQRALGFTAVYVTHDQSEALAMSDRIVVMNQGRIEQIGTPEAVYDRPANAFVADFIGAANLVPAKPGGDGLDTPLGRILAADPRPASATQICWRPEDAQLANGHALNVIEGQITHRAYQGAHTELYLDVNGTPQRAHVGRGLAPDAGTVRLHLPPERIRHL